VFNSSGIAVLSQPAVFTASVALYSFFLALFDSPNLKLALKFK